ncbi:hypothetical protein B0T13DRAFT_35275 [Neurospora crassa]|nr:hypothetical protein B0T13DRAFT_35275 [Neurospora crassa]
MPRDLHPRRPADGPYEPTSTAAGARLFLFGPFSAPPRAVCRCHQVLDFRRQICSGFYPSVSFVVLLPCHQRPQLLSVHTMRLRPFARNWISRYTHGDCPDVVQQCLHQLDNERGLHGVESLRGRTAATPQTETRLASYDGMARALCFPSPSAAASSYYIYRHIDGSYQSLITYTMSKT